MGLKKIFPHLLVSFSTDIANNKPSGVRVGLRLGFSENKKKQYLIRRKTSFECLSFISKKQTCSSSDDGSVIGFF